MPPSASSQGPGSPVREFACSGAIQASPLVNPVALTRAAGYCMNAGDMDAAFKLYSLAQMYQLFDDQRVPRGTRNAVTPNALAYILIEVAGEQKLQAYAKKMKVAEDGDSWTLPCTWLRKQKTPIYTTSYVAAKSDAPNLNKTNEEPLFDHEAWWEVLLRDNGCAA